MRYSRKRREEMREVIADLEDAINWLKNDTYENPPKIFHWHLNFAVGAFNHLIDLANPKPIDYSENKS